MINPRIQTQTLFDYYKDRVKFPKAFIANALEYTPPNIQAWEKDGYVPDAALGRMWRKMPTDLAKIKKLQLAKDAEK